MLKSVTGAMVLASACMVLGVSSARADVIYTFTTTQATNTAGNRTLPVSLSFDLANSVVAQGSFSLTVHGSGPDPAESGDVNGFTSLTFTTGRPGEGDFDTATITPTFSNGGGTTQLTFDAAGDVTSTSIDDVFFFNEVHLSGTGTTATGYGASDANVCLGGNPGGACSVTGVWTQSGYTSPSSVPEPAAFGVLACGLLGLGVMRARRS